VRELSGAAALVWVVSCAVLEGLVLQAVRATAAHMLMIMVFVMGIGYRFASCKAKSFSIARRGVENRAAMRVVN
jgi:hypothetical protein